MNIDAMIISVDEPQLDRCIESVKTQTLPFSNIIHVNNMCPEYIAFNTAMSKTTSEWAMKVDGDFILYSDSLEKIVDIMRSTVNDKIFGYFFGLYDTFIEYELGFCSVLRTSLYKKFPFKDKLSNDRKATYGLRSLGYISRKHQTIIVGTHFDQPDELQVFKRFYTQRIKYPHNPFLTERFTELYEKTGNSLYKLALDTRKFVDTHRAQGRYYPGSHNILWDKQLYEEFKNENHT